MVWLYRLTIYRIEHKDQSSEENREQPACTDLTEIVGLIPESIWLPRWHVFTHQIKLGQQRNRSGSRRTPNDPSALAGCLDSLQLGNKPGKDAVGV